MRLSGKVILITGSTTGIGAALATRCIAEGASVLVHGRDEPKGRELVSELGTSAELIIADLADPNVPAQLVVAAVKRFGKLDAVVNNAACVTRSNLQNTTPELFGTMMAVNVRAPLLIIQAALEELKKTRGTVLNIGSINGYCGEENLLAYSVSKGAMMTLSRNLADALGTSQVRVNHFNVAWTLTENEYRQKIADGLPADWPERVGPEQAPSGRLMLPEEIAAAAIYWISDESRPISGSVVDLAQFPVIGRNPPKRV